MDEDVDENKNCILLQLSTCSRFVSKKYNMIFEEFTMSKIPPVHQQQQRHQKTTSTSTKNILKLVW